MPFIVMQTVDGRTSRLIAHEGTLLQAIAGSLDELDTVDLLELLRNYVPAARLKALNDESRTRPVRLRPDEPTIAVSVGEIQRELTEAAAEANAEGELD